MTWLCNFFRVSGRTRAGPRRASPACHPPQAAKSRIDRCTVPAGPMIKALSPSGPASMGFKLPSPRNEVTQRRVDAPNACLWTEAGGLETERDKNALDDHFLPSRFRRVLDHGARDRVAHIGIGEGGSRLRHEQLRRALPAPPPSPARAGLFLAASLAPFANGTIEPELAVIKSS
jgi:hypothetical protein